MFARWLTSGSLLTLLLFPPLSLDAMDQARAETGTDRAAARFKVAGRKVLVAIMDRGIDWRNDDFRDKEGATRIEWLFDLTDDRGAKAPGNPHQMGTIYSRQEIDDALKKDHPLRCRDAVGHGTTTAGIAAGNGRNSPAGKYRGIAPQASLIVVKIVSDGMPAHDGEPAEEPFYKPERIPVAIDFIAARSRKLGMPCVMLLNLGSQIGPTDGTSALCRKIDATVGPGKPSLVFVTGPGDDGGRQNRAGGVVQEGASAILKIEKEAKTPITLDLWYAAADRLDVSVRSPAGEQGPFAGPAANDAVTSASGEHFQLHHLGAARNYFESPGKREVWLQLKGPPGDYELKLLGRKGTTRFDATLGPNPASPTTPPFNRFTTFAAPGSIWDGATARHNICPGDYVIRTDWQDIDGQPRAKKDEGLPGAIWKGSSVGPTFDGRHGVDCCAPGDSVFTTYNPRSHWATFRANLVHDGKGKYGRASAVSAAAPLTAGIIALMLGVDPELDALSAKTILQETARADRFTGQTPNAVWGHGKIDALAALQLTRERRQARQP